MSEDKYKNKYRIPSNRLQGYDYSLNGCYYVTICTQNRIHYFGEIVEEPDVHHVETRRVETKTRSIASLPPPHKPSSHKTLRKTEIGEIAEKSWLDIPNHFPFVVLDQYVIMPNHIHGILIFNKNDALHYHRKDAIPSKDAIYRVSPTIPADITTPADIANTTNNNNPSKDAIYRVSPITPADIATPTDIADTTTTNNPSKDAIYRVSPTTPADIATSTDIANTTNNNPSKDAIYRVSPTTPADIATSADIANTTNNNNPSKDAIYRVSPTTPADITALADIANNTNNTPTNNTTANNPNNNPSRDAINRVFTKAGGITGIHNPMLQTNLGRVMRWFKGRVSFECRSHVDFAWLERYHDEIIHNNERLNNVRAYIFNNPANWGDDEWNVI